MAIGHSPTDTSACSGVTNISYRHSSWTPGHFMHFSITTPIVPALKNYYIESFLEVPTGVLNHFWILVAVSLLKPPHGGFRIERPSRNRFGSETVTKL
jgi:hypothetical protein